MNASIIHLARNACTGLAASVLLVACGGGDSGSGTVAPATSTLSIGLTDAPLQGVTKIWISITGVEIKPAGGNALTFSFGSPKGFDLVTLQNGNAATLLPQTTVPAGSYEWIRLILDPAADASYVIENGAQHSLNVPSGAETGLKLVQGFTMPLGGTADFTIDFVADRSIIAPPGRGPIYTLRPALRLVDNAQVGTLSGTFDTQTLANNPACATKAPTVYVYQGSPVTPDDIYVPATGSTDTPTGPLTTAPATLNGNSLYAYKVGFLQAGTYTVAYTCNQDDPLLHDTIAVPPASPTLTFTKYPTPVTITAKQTTTANF